MQVDLNVTRHLEEATNRTDWDCLFLHYLGLDHVGHLSGPSSAPVGPKLREMDRVVEYLKTSLDEKVGCFFLMSLLQEDASRWIVNG